MNDRRPDLSKAFLRNILASYLSSAALLVIAFVFTPFLIQTLGVHRYGLWVLVMSIAQYTMLFDMGLLKAVRRYQSRAMATGNASEVNEVVGVSLLIYVPAGILACSICLSAVWWLPQCVDMPADIGWEFIILAGAMGLDMFISFARVGFMGVIFGANRLDYEQYTLVLQQVVLAGVAVLLLSLWRRDLYSPSIAAVLSVLVALFASYRYAFRVFPNLHVSFGSFRSPLLRPMLRFGLQASLFAVSVITISQLPKLLVGGFLDTAQAGMLAVPLLLTARLKVLVKPLGTALFPVAARMDIKGRDDALRDLYVRGSRLCFLVAISTGVPLIFLGDRFLSLWVGPMFSRASLALIILLIGNIVEAGQQPAEHILAAARSIRGLSLGMAVRALATTIIIVLVLSATDWGLAGVAMGISVPSVIYFGVYASVLACRHLNLPLGTYWLLSHGRGALVLVISALMSILIRYLWPADTLWLSVMQLLVAAGGSFLIAAIFALDVSDRIRLRLAFSRRSRT